MEQLTGLIELPRLFFNIFWIVGLSIIAAALSLHHFYAQEKNITFREALQAPNFQLCLWIGLALATIGFAGNAAQWWEQLIWIVLTILNMVHIYLATKIAIQNR